jgi:hypothetical protein
MGQHDGPDPAKLSQRRGVEVVVMDVRDEDQVDAGEPVQVEGWHAPPHVYEPAAKQRVGQDPHTVELDQDSRMPYEREAHRRTMSAEQCGLLCVELLLAEGATLTE